MTSCHCFILAGSTSNLKMSQQESFISRTAVVLLCLVCIATVLPIASSSDPALEEHLPGILNRTGRAAQSGCRTVLGTIAIPHDGCETRFITMAQCEGKCLSLSLTSLEAPPYQKQDCSCCGVHIYAETKFRKLKFRCGPDRQVKKVRIGYSQIQECRCVQCSGALV